MKRIKLVIILGPTAAGKSRIALGLAERFNGEIISADSRQVYKLMDIGTAKPSATEQKRIKHHLIDLIYPDDIFDAARYRKEATEAIEDIVRRGKSIIVVGGTGLYIKVLIRGIFKGPKADIKLREKLKKEAEVFGDTYLYKRLKEIDPPMAQKIHIHDMFRIIRALEVYQITGKPLSKFQQEHNFCDNPYEVLKIGIGNERESLYLKINKRVNEMIEDGLVDEVRALLKRGYGPGLKAMQTFGYKQICDYVLNGVNFDESVKLTKQDTRRYAKRQITWFKRDGEIAWFNPDEEKNMFQLTSDFFYSK